MRSTRFSLEALPSAKLLALRSTPSLSIMPRSCAVDHLPSDAPALVSSPSPRPEKSSTFFLRCVPLPRTPNIARCKSLSRGSCPGMDFRFETTSSKDRRATPFPAQRRKPP